MFQRNFIVFPFPCAVVVAVAVFLIFTGCQRAAFEKQTVAPAALRDVPALKLNFRFEPDVPEPTVTNPAAAEEEKNAVIQTDFDANRSPESLERTVTSPDKQRVVAVYRRVEDLPGDYRLDIYNAADGKLLRKVTPNGMAARFPDTIVWSPDSNNIAFVAATRPAQSVPAPEGAPAVPTPMPTDANANVDANSNAETPPAPAAAAPPPPTPEPPKPVLTFRTEQIYTSSREGTDVKPLTQNEGLIYFYFIWSPDSTALVSLAASWREWQVASMQAGQRGEIFTPAGRPRVVERSGRERRLDDNVTIVQPVWSPDSAKVAVAFDKEVRIYDAVGDAPTQAAIPLRNPLLLSSKIYDDELRRKEQSGENSNAANANSNSNAANANANVNSKANANSNANANANAVAAPLPANPDINTLPDENLLVSFNPIVKLVWTEDKMLYAQTGFVREYRNQSENRYSYLRWHRLVFSPQPTAIN